MPSYESVVPDDNSAMSTCAAMSHAKQNKLTSVVHDGTRAMNMCPVMSHVKQNMIQLQGCQIIVPCQDPDSFHLV